MILFCHIVYVYVYKKFGDCWWSFSWLGQKVKANMHSSTLVDLARSFCL